jgi:hypothetical protein
MVNKAKKTSKKVKQQHHALASHPATSAMIARVGGCNKPPILWRKQGDSWMECFLKSDCTYGNCQEVDASQVPPSIRGGGG